MKTDGNDASWRLYERAINILDGQATGHALPIIRHLASRHFAPAVNVLSDYVTAGRAIAMLRRAARSGDAVSAYNLAITHRNRGNMTAYRMALARAAKLDPTGDAEGELRRFRTRFPEPVMRRLRRLSSSRF